MENLRENGIAPNVIFLDSVMPKMSGIDACKQIRELGYDGVIIAVTGNVLDSDREEFLSAGADRLIPKPFNITVFQDTLKGEEKNITFFCYYLFSLIFIIEYSRRLSSPSYSGSHPSYSKSRFTAVSHIMNLHGTGTGITHIGSNDQSEYAVSLRRNGNSISRVGLNILSDEEV